MLIGLALWACTSKTPDTGDDTSTGDTAGTAAVDADGDGSSPPDDCDDANPAVHPGADEHCDGVDEDCDGSVDEDAVDAPITYAAAAGGPGDEARTDTVWMTAGDLDGDGIVDLAYTVSDGEVHVVHGAGDGSFAESLTQPAGTEVWDITVADLDGDGILELIYANYDDHTVTVARQDGAGGFTTADFPTDSAPIAVAVADVDGDGAPDVVAGDQEDIEILPGDGTGAVGAPVDLASDGAINGVATADLDGDGDVDLVAASNIGFYDVLLSDGAGGWEPFVSTPAGKYVSDPTLADLDGDGVLDLVLPEFHDDDVRVLLGAGDGTFSGTEVHHVAGPYQVYAADFDGDGILDLLASGTPDFGLLHGHGDGTFDDLVPWGTSFGASAVGDFDGNGVLDAAWLDDAEPYAVDAVLGTRVCAP